MWNSDFEAAMREHCPLLADGSSLDPDTPLVLLGVDSMGVIGLIVELERKLNVEIPEDFLTPEIFATPGDLWKALEDRFGLSSTDGSSISKPNQPAPPIRF
jgi:acyl carrier protein